MILATIGVLAVLGLIGLRFYNQAQRAKQDKADREAIDQALNGVETMAAAKRNTTGRSGGIGID